MATPVDYRHLGTGAPQLDIGSHIEIARRSGIFAARRSCQHIDARRNDDELQAGQSVGFLNGRAQGAAPACGRADAIPRPRIDAVGGLIDMQLGDARRSGGYNGSRSTCKDEREDDEAPDRLVHGVPPAYSAPRLYGPVSS